MTANGMERSEDRYNYYQEISWSHDDEPDDEGPIASDGCSNHPLYERSGSRFQPGQGENGSLLSAASAKLPPDPAQAETAPQDHLLFDLAPGWA